MTEPIVSLHSVEQWHPAGDDTVRYEICECRHGDQSLGYALLLGKLRLNLLADAGFSVDGTTLTTRKSPFKDSELSDVQVNCYSSVPKAQAAAEKHHNKFGQTAAPAA